MTISNYLDALRSKKKTCVELISDYLDRIEKFDVKINSFITVDKDNALKKAAEVDKVIENYGVKLDELFEKYPLLGVPVGFKDIYSTKGVETTAASNILRGYIPPYNATVVEKYESAGAIMLGKLNCDAFAHGASGHNSDFGDTKNPYDLSRIPGGSSSGCGAAVAADFVLAAGGTDTGGSIRNPACWCNLVGLKPTYGRVSRYGVIAMASSLDSIGHLTKTVEDNARILNVTAGFDKNDTTSSKQAPDDYLKDLNKGVNGLKIGLPKEYLTDDVDKEIKDATFQAAEILEKNGAEIIEVSLPNTEYALAVYYIITPSEVSSNLGRFDGIRYGHDRSKFGDEAKRRIMIGTYVLSEGFYDAYYLKAQKVREMIAEDFRKAYEKVDVILAPVTPFDPLKIGEDLDDPMKMYLIDVLSVTANLAGIPSLSVPAGFSSQDLPIGVQIMGKHFDEKVLYRVGKVIEDQLKMYERRPAL